MDYKPRSVLSKFSVVAAGLLVTATLVATGPFALGVASAGTGPGELAAPVGSLLGTGPVLNNTHWKVQTGDIVTGTIENTSLPDGSVDVIIQSSYFGNQTVSGTAAGGTITFTFDTNSVTGGVCGTSVVAYVTEGNLTDNALIPGGNGNGPGGFAFVDALGNVIAPNADGTCGGTPLLPAPEPIIFKTAAAGYSTQWTWGISKAVDKTKVEQVGGNATFNYTVTVTHDNGTNSALGVSGVITLTNTDSTASVQISGLSDQLSDGTICSVTVTLPATLLPGPNNFPYTCSDTNSPTPTTIDNTATMSWGDQTLTDSTFLGAGQASFTVSPVPITQLLIDNSVTVTDDWGGTTTPLGTVDETQPSPHTFQYSHTVPVPTSGCQSYNNTAAFTTNTPLTTGSSNTVTVTVCGPAATGALTIGFWKNSNGNGLISNYCAPTAKTSLATYLSSLGAGNGPFKDAAGLSCSKLVTYVNGIISGASATNMNVMLKAQMLGTALDVYFSSSSYGWTSTTSGSIKPPSKFFVSGAGLGSFNMDMTAICPEIDNTTTGSATCTGGLPSTNAYASGAVPAAAMTIQQILDFEATTTLTAFNGPFNGLTGSGSIWYGSNRTSETIAKNIFDQVNNQQAFGA
jgi:hypothetical protein